MRRRRLGYVTPPPGPDQSPYMRVVKARIDAVAADRWPEQYLSAIERELALEAGNLFHRALLVNASAEVRAAIAQTDGLDRVLGWWEVTGRASLIFHPGLAALTEQESRAWWLKAGGFDERQIAEYMDGKRRRTRQFGVSIETVNRHIANGRAKLAGCFGAVA